MADDDLADGGTEAKIQEWEFERMRDISGLRPHHRWQIHGHVPPMDLLVEEFFISFLLFDLI